MENIDKALEEHLLSFFKKRTKQKDHDNFAKDKEAFVFHMTDWSEDLRKVVELYEKPESLKDEDAHRALWSLIFHVLEHLLSAAEIYDGWPRRCQDLPINKR